MLEWKAAHPDPAVRGPNKLVLAVLKGLCNKYVVSGIHARGYIFLVLASPG